MKNLDFFDRKNQSIFNIRILKKEIGFFGIIIKKISKNRDLR